MPSYDEAALAEIETLFGNLRENSFAKTMSGSIPYEDQAGSKQLSPAGFTADSAIEQVVGFAWEDFSVSGIYNSSFFLGVQDQQLISTYNNPTTTEEYLSGLSKQLPYWQVNAPSGNPTLEKVDDAAAVGEKALKWHGSSVDAMIVQDVPVVPGKVYKIRMVWRYDNSGGSEFMRTFGYQFRKGDHSAIDSLVEGGLSFTDTQSDYIETNLTSNEDLVAPANARFLRIRLTMSATQGNPSIWVNSISATTDNSGDDFPANPSHHDRWFEQDTDMEYFWDNNLGLWLSTQKFYQPLVGAFTTATATTRFLAMSAPNTIDGQDYYVEKFALSFFLTGGSGTNLSASHKWTVTLERESAGAYATHTIDSNGQGVNVWQHPAAQSVNALFGTADSMISVLYTKTGTPHNFTAVCAISYRLVHT